MFRQVGRLTPEDMKELRLKVVEIFEQVEKKKATSATRRINLIANTANYFVREELGKLLAECEDPEFMDEICHKMLKHKIYGIRATALFYFYYKDTTNAEEVIIVLDKYYNKVPWEAETIALNMWKKHPKTMKKYMHEWQKDKDEVKRSLSLHGMENIASSDPKFIMSFIGNMIDDESLEVQKKITHILTQVGRSKPNKCYPVVKEWLETADEQRIKTIWVSMKKLANIITQQSNRDKSAEFVKVTTRTVKEWKKDQNQNVSVMGGKLAQILKIK
ncbi:DNA alkylation repair protein [bacterium]|nr:DNA alkylation repair protein [bacterium]